MLGTIVRVVAAAAATSALAAPAGAHRNWRLEVDPQLMELRGEIVQVYRQRGNDTPIQIALSIKNTNYSGERQPGHDAGWTIYADSDLMKAAGITTPMLYKEKIVTFVGYRADTDECGGLRGRCLLAARQIRFDNGCTLFIGRAAPVFGIKPYAHGWNVPNDGLDKVDRSRC